MTPRSAHRRRSRRVSSAATTSAPAISWASRGAASRGSPIGVAARTRTPARGGHRADPVRCGTRASTMARMTRTEQLRIRLLGFRPTDTFWGWLGPLFFAVVGGLHAVLVAGPPAPAGLRRDVLRQAGRLDAPTTASRCGCRTRSRSPTSCSPAARRTSSAPRATSSSTRRWASGSSRSASSCSGDVVVRLALLGVRARDPVDPDDRPGRTTDVRVDAAGHHRRVPARLRGPPLRPVPHRAARPHRHVLGAGGVLRPAHRPRPARAPSSPSGRPGCPTGALAAGLGPVARGWRPWRWVAGICLGLCAGTKWSGLFFLVAFGLMTVLVGHGRPAGRRGAALVLGHGRPRRAAGPRSSCAAPPWRPTSCPGWAGSASTTGYDRQWGADPPVPRHAAGCPTRCGRCGTTTRRSTRSTSTCTTTTRTGPTRGRGSSRAGRRRSSTRGPSSGEDGCAVAQCSKAITSIGTVSIWWLGAAAIFVLVFYWLFKPRLAGRRHPRRAWPAATCPWFGLEERTIYSFYTVAFEPWVIFAWCSCSAWPSAAAAPTRGDAARSACTPSAPTACSRWRSSRSSGRSTPRRSSRRATGPTADVVPQLDLTARRVDLMARRVDLANPSGGPL